MAGFINPNTYPEQSAMSRGQPYGYTQQPYLPNDQLVSSIQYPYSLNYPSIPPSGMMSAMGTYGQYDPLKTTGSFVSRNPCNFHYEFIPANLAPLQGTSAGPYMPSYGQPPMLDNSMAPSHMAGLNTSLGPQLRPASQMIPPPTQMTPQSQIYNQQGPMAQLGQIGQQLGGQPNYNYDMANSYGIPMNAYGGGCQPGSTVGGSIWKGCSNSPYQGMGYFGSASLNAWY